MSASKKLFPETNGVRKMSHINFVAENHFKKISKIDASAAGGLGSNLCDVEFLPASRPRPEQGML